MACPSPTPLFGGKLSPSGGPHPVGSGQGGQHQATETERAKNRTENFLVISQTKNKEIDSFYIYILFNPIYPKYLVWGVFQPPGRCNWDRPLSVCRAVGERG